MAGDLPTSSKVSSGLWRWMCGHREEFSDEIRAVLMKTLLTRTPSMVLASVSVMLLALMTAARFPGNRWPYAWIGIETILLIVRLEIIGRARPTLARGEFGPFYLYTFFATSWCALLGLGGYVCVLTGDGVLAALAAVNVSAVAAGISTRAAAFPRLAIFQIMLVGLPYAIAAAFTPVPWFFVLAIEIPMCLAAMASLTLSHYSHSINLIRAERENWFLASHDTLTSLPNRKNLLDRLDALCAARSESDSGPFAVLCLDLDGFKTVNDTFGHPAGDRLLIAVAERLRLAVRAGDVVSRTGGDEFVILLAGADEADAARAAERIIAAIARPVALDGSTELTIGVTIGSALAPRDGRQAGTLLSLADQALYEAKRAQRGTYRTSAQPARPLLSGAVPP